MSCKFLVQLLHIGKLFPVVKVTLITAVATLYLAVMPGSAGRNAFVQNSFVRCTALPTVSRWTSLLRTAAPLRFFRSSVYTVLPLDGALLPVLSYSWEALLSLWNGLW